MRCCFFNSPPRQPLGKPGLSVLPLMLPRTGAAWELEGPVVAEDPLPPTWVSALRLIATSRTSSSLCHTHLADVIEAAMA